MEGRSIVAPTVMKKRFAFSQVIRWLKSTELFARPSREIPGNWQLFEYYTEPAGELIHVKEEELTAGAHFLKMTFNSDGLFRKNSRLPLSFMPGMDVCKWDVRGNFITFIHPENFRENVTFQFAMERKNLKLLKKSVSGKIEFFGFFRKTGEPDS